MNMTTGRKISRRKTLQLGLGLGAAPLAASLADTAEAAEHKPGETRRCLTPAAAPLPLEAIRLEDGPLKRAQDMNGAYLQRLEPDRMLAYLRERAGLAPRAEPYGGWDGGGRNLTGHIAGHYLSAVSLMYAATSDREFARRAQYIVDIVETD